MCLVIILSLLSIPVCRHQACPRLPHKPSIGLVYVQQRRPRRRSCKSLTNHRRHASPPTTCQCPRGGVFQQCLRGAPCGEWDPLPFLFLVRPRAANEVMSERVFWGREHQRCPGTCRANESGQPLRSIRNLALGGALLHPSSHPLGPKRPITVGNAQLPSSFAIPQASSGQVSEVPRP